MPFKAESHLTNLSRDPNKPRMYLETKWRLVWLREEHPDWRVDTELLQVDPYPVVKARIINAEGELIASGHGCAQHKSGSVYAGREIEKAETAAIGRALAHAGYGTQYVGEDEEDSLADSPVERPQSHIWTDVEIAQFVKNYRAATVSDAEALEALGVKGLREWKGTLAMAEKRLDDYIGKQLKSFNEVR